MEIETTYTAERLQDTVHTMQYTHKAHEHKHRGMQCMTLGLHVSPQRSLASSPPQIISKGKHSAHLKSPDVRLENGSENTVPC